MRTMHRVALTVGMAGVSALTAVVAGAQTEAPPAEPAPAPSAAEALDPVQAFIERLGFADDRSDLVLPDDDDVIVQVFLERDPFEPVVPVELVEAGNPDTQFGTALPDSAPPGAGPTGGGVSPPPPSPPPSPQPSPPPSPQPTGEPDGAACTGSTSEAVCDGVVVTADSVGEDVAAITVDDTTAEAQVGDVVDGSFLVVDIAEPCVSLMYEDEGLSVCEGAPALK